MTRKTPTHPPDNPKDRRDVIHQGSSLSGSTKRDNTATEDAVRPKSGKVLSDEEPDAEVEIVDQDPGERQKRNQGDDKDDPLAA